MGLRVVFDAAAGVARVGSTVVPVTDAGADGSLRVGGAAGPVLRPLAFGERTRVVSRARAAPDPRESVCAGVRGAATVVPGEGDPVLLDVIALALCGADEPAPPFADAALLVARAAGWDPSQLLEAPAAEVDRLARQLGGAPSASGWTRFVFADDDGGELEEIRAELAEALLERVDEAAGEAAPAPDTFAAPQLPQPSGGNAPGHAWARTAAQPGRTPHPLEDTFDGSMLSPTEGAAPAARPRRTAAYWTPPPAGPAGGPGVASRDGTTQAGRALPEVQAFRVEARGRLPAAAAGSAPMPPNGPLGAAPVVARPAAAPAAKPPIRNGPVEAVRGNREVPPTDPEVGGPAVAAAAAASGSSPAYAAPPAAPWTRAPAAAHAAPPWPARSLPLRLPGRDEPQAEPHAARSLRPPRGAAVEPSLARPQRDLERGPLAEFAHRLATLLDDESDLRGLAR